MTLFKTVDSFWGQRTLTRFGASSPKPQRLVEASEGVTKCFLQARSSSTGVRLTWAHVHSVQVLRHRPTLVPRAAGGSDPGLVVLIGTQVVLAHPEV